MNNYNAAEGIITIDLCIAGIRLVADAHLERNIISHTDKDFIHKFVCSLVLRVIRERGREAQYIQPIIGNETNKSVTKCKQIKQYK